jgi:hypothetical protein
MKNVQKTTTSVMSNVMTRAMVSILYGLIILMISSINPAQSADFLRDFYDQSLTNYTSPSEYKTATQNGVSGGSLYMRWPNQSYSPLTFTPPSFGMHGCRGIDLNMGSFSMINADAFVDMLRSIGQNAKGLFFQIALQAAAPEVNSAITSLSKTVQDFNRYFRNSCESAQTLLNKTGLSSLAKELGEGARKYAMGSGTSTDAGKADTDSSDPNYIKTNQPTYTRSDGTTVKLDNKNYTWQAISDAGFGAGLSPNLKQLMLSVAGTYIVKWNGTNLDVKYYPPTIDDMRKLIGVDQTPMPTSQTIPLYQCGLDPTCVGMLSSDTNYLPLYPMFYQLLNNAYDNIRSRTDWLDTNTLALFGRSHLPLAKVMDILSTKYDDVAARKILSDTAEIMAVEFARDFMTQMRHELRRSIDTAKADTVSRSKAELDALQKISDTLEKQTQVAYELAKTANQNLADIQDFAARHEYFSNAVYGLMSKQTMEAAQFGAMY